MARFEEHDHVLPDGTTIHLRRLRPDDRQRLFGMWERTSEASRRARFHGPFDLTDENVGRFTDLDPDHQFAVAATLGRGEDERVVAVARYERDPDEPGHAEFAALVEDDQQGRGIGTVIVREVAQQALEDGVRRLSGDVLADNARMLRLIRDIGLEFHSVHEPGGGSVVRADLELGITETFLRAVADDERQAARAALGRFFKPERVAVVGASRDPASLGGLVFANVIAGGFSGVVYPVNPNTTHVQGVAAYPDLASCPGLPDLVVVCVPAPLVPDVVDEAGELGVRAVCVVSAGFAEVGEEGRARQDELMARARGHGMRIVGPNCMGLLNGTEGVRLNATFSRTFPRPGRVSMSSQSGALGLAVLDHVDRIGLGISTFVSVGNKADISGNDLLLYWEDDPDTDVALLYLESFGNPRKFSRIARRISRRKPIVAVKSGRTRAGERAASSHTAAVSSGDVAVEALFAQTGVIRTETLEELFDVATLLSSQPLPRGDRVAILTNAGGPGILAADACESNGLRVPPLTEATREALATFLPPEAGMQNPVDMIASADPAAFGRALEVLGNAEEVDAVFVIFIPAGATETDAVAEALADAAGRLPADVAVVSVLMSQRGVPDALQAASLPAFSFPEDAARALGRVARYASWRAAPLGSVVRPDGIDVERARTLVDGALRRPRSAGGQPLIGRPHAAAVTRTKPRGSLWLSAAEAEGVLASYGIPLARSRIVSSPEEAAAAQADLGCPVAIKVASPIHKTDVGGVELDLRSPAGAARAVERMVERLEAADLAQHAEAFLVQEMVTDGVEMVVGVSSDPSFGPLVVVGMGGTLVELIHDVSVRITPLTDVDVDAMLGDLRMAPLLHGYRGAPPADVAALTDLLHRVNALVEDLPEVVELDLNPVFVRPSGQGVVAVDVRMRVSNE
ncbi:MAG: GNAT family N-acetyltransferase [Actinomycetes bacterium]